MKAKLTLSDETKKPPKTFVTTKVPPIHPNTEINIFLWQLQINQTGF